MKIQRTGLDELTLVIDNDTWANIMEAVKAFCENWSEDHMFATEEDLKKLDEQLT